MTIYVNFLYPTRKLNKLINEFTDPLFQCQTMNKIQQFTIKSKNLLTNNSSYSGHHDIKLNVF